MRALVHRVARAMRALAPQGSRVIAAVSGGPDSVAMTHLLHRTGRRGHFELSGLAHFNHKLRDEAAGDEAFCRTLAADLGLPFFTGSADVGAEAAACKRSIEDTGRRLRYAFLERARSDAGADLVAVGHTKDDQAETFLLRLLRGAGPGGLRGIHRVRGAIIRPLLDVRRAELGAWLTAEGLPYRIDETNADLTFPRNRVRHELLPFLERFSPRATETLARAASIAAEDHDLLERSAIEAARGIVLEEGGGVSVDLGQLGSVHPALARRILRAVMLRMAPERFVGLAHVEAARHLTRGTLHLPGQRVLSDGQRLVFERTGDRQGRPTPAATNVFRYLLSIPGEVQVPECGVSVRAELLTQAAASADTLTDGVAIQADAVPDGLAVRNRRPGDRFQPRGLSGTKKLQDYFVDRKVPRAQRDRVPLVVDGRDRIVWVVGHAVAEGFAVKAPGRAVLLLKVRHLGERF